MGVMVKETAGLPPKGLQTGCALGGIRVPYFHAIAFLIFPVAFFNNSAMD